jgi:hypothetical protein
MTEPASNETGHRAADMHETEKPPGIPRWLKWSLVVVVLLIVLALVISQLAGIRHGPGQFGPGQHGMAPASWRSITRT